MVCDYCGGEIVSEHDARSLAAFEAFAAVGSDVPHGAAWIAVGQYHDNGCWPKVRDAIRTAEAFGQGIEDRDVKSGQWVAAQRRKLRRDQGRT